MEEWDRLCPGCFATKGEAVVCPYCGYDESERRTPLALPHRTVLNGQFLVGRMLGKPGGFGIAYLGWDINLDTPVAIKEYLPRDYAGRDSDRATVVAHSREDADLFRFGLEQFLQEARTLAKFDHPNVVRVRSFFEQHGTAYLVMDYLQGMNLAEYLTTKGGRLTEQEAGEIMLPILNGLQEVHAKGFLHRDIKPQNIFVTAAGRPILLDFGAARQAMGERSRSLSVVLTQGFAPYEQYHRRGEQGPWTDIYAVGATYYYLLTGQAPPDAAERVAVDELKPISDLVPGISPGLAAAVMQALSQEASLRPQDVFIFRDMVLGKTSASLPGVAAPAAVTPVAVTAPPPLPPVVPNASSSSPPPPAVRTTPHTNGARVIASPSPAATPPSVQARPYLPPAEPIRPPARMPEPPPPPRPAAKSGGGLWLKLLIGLAVLAAAGWFFLGGEAPHEKKAAPVAKPAVEDETEDTKKSAPPVKTPQSEKKPAQTPTAPTVPPGQPSGPASGSTKPAVPPTEKEHTPQPSPDDSSSSEPPAQPKPPVVRTQPQTPTEKTPQTPPKRDKGSLW